MSLKAEDATQLLLDAGSLLHFSGRAGLPDYVVLEPRWLTSLLTLLLLRHRGARNGILSTADLSSTWAAAGYPRELHPALFALLEKYDVAFFLPGDAARMLVPALLPPTPPERLAGPTPSRSPSLMSFLKVSSSAVFFPLSSSACIVYFFLLW